MEHVLVPIVACATLFVGMPWVILHYVTKWRQAKTLTSEDENLLDALFHTARRLEDRLDTIERIVAADNPDYRPAAPHPAPREDDDYPYSRRN